MRTGWTKRLLGSRLRFMFMLADMLREFDSPSREPHSSVSFSSFPDE
jgi:hypothetical protein